MSLLLRKHGAATKLSLQDPFLNSPFLTGIWRPVSFRSMRKPRELRKRRAIDLMRTATAVCR